MHAETWQNTFFLLLLDLEQKIEQLKERRDELQNQFFNWARIRIRTRALQTEFIGNPRSTSGSLARSVGIVALVSGTVAIPFTIGMSGVYGKAVATGAVAAIATGAAGAAIYAGIVAAAVDLGGVMGAAATLTCAVAAATAAGIDAKCIITLSPGINLNAALAGVAITIPLTLGMSVVYGEAVLTGAVAAVAAGAAGAAGAVAAAGAVVVAAASAVEAAKATEATPTAGATGATAAAGGLIALAVVGRAGAVASRLETKLHVLFIQDGAALLGLKLKSDLLKHCVADLAVYCREYTDQVLSSRLMAREVPFLRDILRKREAVFELNVGFTRFLGLLERLLQFTPYNEDSKIISRQILHEYELTEGPNDEEIRAMIVDFIEKEFTFSFFESSDHPGGSKYGKMRPLLTELPPGVTLPGSWLMYDDLPHVDPHVTEVSKG